MDRLEQWVDQHQATVYRAAYMILRERAAAEDVAQETFIRAHRAAPRLAPGSDVRGWLYRIATNLALNHLRSRKREAAAVERVARQPSTGVDDLAERRAVRSAVAQALSGLPDRLRVPVILRYYLDLSEQDIARELQVRPGTVKSRLHEARKILAGDEAIAAAAT